MRKVIIWYCCSLLLVGYLLEVNYRDDVYVETKPVDKFQTNKFFKQLEDAYREYMKTIRVDGIDV